MQAALDVVVHGILAGTVRPNRAGEALFAYDESYLSSSRAVPLSITIPLREGDHQAGQWLDNLLPDNATIRQRWRDRYGLQSVHPLDLLSTPVGRDCAGAVQFCLQHQADDLIGRPGALVPLNDSDVGAIITYLNQTGGDWVQGDDDWGFSLAGAMAKTALHYDDGKWYRPTGKTPTNRILKPAPARFPDLDVVEHVCLSAASTLNLRVGASKTECREIGGQRVLVVERYDRGGTYIPD